MYILGVYECTHICIYICRHVYIFSIKQTCLNAPYHLLPYINVVVWSNIQPDRIINMHTQQQLNFTRKTSFVRVPSAVVQYVWEESKASTQILHTLHSIQHSTTLHIKKLHTHIQETFNIIALLLYLHVTHLCILFFTSKKETLGLALTLLVRSPEQAKKKIFEQKSCPEEEEEAKTYTIQFSILTCFIFFQKLNTLFCCFPIYWY